MVYSHYDFKYIDAHVHFFPPQIFKAIWEFFEAPDEDGNVRGWPVNYQLPTESLVQTLERMNVDYFTTLNYAHKRGVAEYINDWVHDFASNCEKAIPFGSVWPEDDNRVDYIEKMFDEYNFLGVKIQPLVQRFYFDDERLYKVYDMIQEKGKWLVLHAGTAPMRNEYVGYKHFMKFYERYPDMNIIIAHMGAFEYAKFFSLLEKHENIYLDTTMIYIPDNIFPERGTKRPKPEDLVSYQDRILFGTDFPNIPYDYENSTKGLLEFDLPRGFYENVFYNNAKRLFKI